MDLLTETVASALRPEPVLTVSAWADRHRVLSGHSAEPGPWRTRRTPYLRTIMDALSVRSPVQRVVVMKAAQLGVTEAALNWLGYVIEHAPAPFLYVAPTVETAKRLSRHKVDPLIAATPALRQRVRSPRSREAGNTVLLKVFPGGLVVLTGANSAVGLRSMSCRFVCFDEVDGYPVDVEGEGDPIRLVEARARTFGRRKLLLISTPTVAGMSRIAREYAATDMRKYFVPCPACGTMQVLEFARLIWTPGAPETVHYTCAGCGGAITEAQKAKCLAAGEWRATTETAPDPTVAGFWLSALYAPVGWLSWVDIATAAEEARRDPAEQKTFTNTVLGEPYAEPHDAPDWHRLRERQTADPLGRVPPSALFLTAGVDLQRDRLEVSVWGWGRDRRCWLVDHQVLDGDPFTDAPWPALTALVARTWLTLDGAHALTLARVAVDTGHAPAPAHAWARAQGPGLALLVRGGPPGPGLVWLPRYTDAVETRRTVTRRRRGLAVWQVNVDAFKRELYGRLRLAGVAPGEPTPPGWVALPAIGDEFLRQLTAEALVRKSPHTDALEWQPVNYRRNEALDCWVYARAAAFLVQRRDQFTAADWVALEACRGIAPPAPAAPVPAEAPPPGPAAAAPTVVPVPGAPAPPRPRRPASGFWAGRESSLWGPRRRW